MQKALFPIYDIYRFFVSRNERGNGFTSIGDYVDTLAHRLEDYILKKSKERLIAAASKSNRNIRTEKRQKLKNRNGKKNNCIDTSSTKLVRLHKGKSWHERNIRKENESLLIVAQNNAIRINYIKCKSIISNKIATVDYVAAKMKRNKLVQNKYKNENHKIFIYFRDTNEPPNSIGSTNPGQKSKPSID